MECVPPSAVAATPCFVARSPAVIVWANLVCGTKPKPAHRPTRVCVCVCVCSQLLEDAASKSAARRGSGSGNNMTLGPVLLMK
jgi:hypothetical protein